MDFAPFLSRTLLGSHGQELLIEGTSEFNIIETQIHTDLVQLLLIVSLLWVFKKCHATLKNVVLI